MRRFEGEKWKKEFLKALREDPEFAREVRQIVLGEEILQVPQRVAELTQNVVQISQEIAKLVSAVSNLTSNVRSLEQRYDNLVKSVEELSKYTRELFERIEKLTERVDSLTQNVDKLMKDVSLLFERYEKLAQKVDGIIKDIRNIFNTISDLASRLDKITERLDKLWEKYEVEVGELKGYVKEIWVAQRAYAIFGKLVVRGREFREAPEILLKAVREGRISEIERDRVLDCNLLWRGEWEGLEIIFTVEVSYTVDEKGVLRAKECARILRKLGYLAVPAVAGVRAEVQDDEVVFVLDGSVERQKFEGILREMSST